MDTAKLFRNGRSQAVRLPKEYALPDVEVGKVQVMSVQGGTATARVVEMKEAVYPGYRVYYKD